MKRMRHSLTGLCLTLLLLGQPGSTFSAWQHAAVTASDIHQLVALRDAGHAFRAATLRLRRTLQESSGVNGVPSIAGQQKVRHAQEQYYRLREPLFRLAFSHASAIVQRLEGASRRQTLIKASISTLASLELVKNLHAVAAVVNDHPPARRVWNQPDPTRGFPANSWEMSLEAARNTRYRDLFHAGHQRLTDHASYLERLWKAEDEHVRALFPETVTRVLQDIEERMSLLEAGLAEEHLIEDEQTLHELVEQSKRLRALWRTDAPRLRGAIERDQGLIRGDVRLMVYKAEKDYLGLRTRLYQLAFTHLPKLTRQDIPYPADVRLHGVGISLLSALTLYENAQELTSSVLSIPGARALLNEGDPTRGIPPHFWDDIQKEFGRIQYRSLAEDGLAAFDRLSAQRNASGVEEDPFLTYVRSEIDATSTAKAIRSESIFKKIRRTLRYYGLRVRDFFRGGLSKGKFEVSKGFGTLVGLVELRKGKLYGQAHWERFVRSRLQPGDILLEKTPFRLTDRFIPGHFGHAALYVGGEEELRALGLLEGEVISRHREESSKGRTIVEALRTGTQLSSLEHFLNIDDLAILRPKRTAISQADVHEAIRLAFSHLGKEYDFNFDTNTWDSIVCSELIFQTYVRVPWNYDKVLSSYTVSPDDIAVFAGSGDDRPFELVTFIHDGELVHDPSIGLHEEELYIRLLGDHYADSMPVEEARMVSR